MGSVRLTKSLLLGCCYFGGALLACSSSSTDPENTTGATQGSPTNAGSPTASSTMTGSANVTGSGGPTTAVTGSGNGNGSTGTSGSNVAGPTNTTTGNGPTTNVGVTGVGGAPVTGGTPATTGSIGDCGITVNSYDISEAISTVGIVTWSATTTITSATIEFGLADGEPTLSAPVDLTEPDYRTLLLGMKGDREYSFQIVADAGGQTCTSEKLTLTTGSVPTNVPLITTPQQPGGEATRSGFIITSAGLGGFGGPSGGGSPAFIFDMDGDPVWWAASPASCSRALMDWEGKNMWMLELNVDAQGGEMRRVSMDGTDVENNVQGLSNAHHDFTVLPGGVIATVSWTAGGESPSDLIERSPDGMIKKVVTLDGSIYAEAGPGPHANSILYHPSDDSYTISDRYPNLYVKLTRAGALVWQFGGSNPVGDFISGGTWDVNHGHHLLDDGSLLVFSNGSTGMDASPVIEYQLNADSTKMAMETFRYSGGSSMVLGDVQRLPNGNTLVTYSVSGVIQEVSPQGMVVQSFETESLGYSMWRPSLYGAPPK